MWKHRYAILKSKKNTKNRQELKKIASKRLANGKAYLDVCTPLFPGQIVRYDLMKCLMLAFNDPEEAKNYAAQLASEMTPELAKKYNIDWKPSMSKRKTIENLMASARK